jgi:signal transduction histidine kinase
MMRSLRSRLLAGTIVGMILLLSIFSLIVYIVIRNSLVKQFDRSLVSITQMLAASVELDGDEIELEFEVQQMSEFHNAEHPTYYQLWTEDGEVVARSPLLRTDDLFHPETPLGKPVSYMEPIKFKRNGKPLRAFALIFRARNSDSDEESTPPQTSVPLLSLTVARDCSDVLDQLQFLRWLLLIASAVVILLSLLIAAIIVQKGLTPLNAIAAEIATITEDNLTKRITTGHVPEEIVPIKNRLNELMSRLEASFNRERQFNADVAHELRTPLAGIRSTIEVTLARNRQTTEYQQALSECLDITKTMQSMVSNLLMLAGLDARRNNVRIEHVNIAQVVDSCWKTYSEKAAHQDVSFDNHVDTDVTCETEHQTLSIVLSNILENAVEYTNTGGQIRATAQRNDDLIEISISNTGCQLTTVQVSHVFDCFWRGDPSRSDAGVHCGLGLALVRKLTSVLGGHVTAELQPERVLTVRLNIPLKSQG